MGRILISPEEVRGVASVFKQKSDESQAMINTLTAKVTELDANWDGMASQRFYQDYETWRQQMGHFVGMLDRIHQELMVIAQRFEEADRAR